MPVMREKERQGFLAGTDWAGATLLPMPADASSRSYSRLRGGPAPALLMDAPPGAEAAFCPPGASPEERRALGFNAEARLAGPSLAAFTELSRWLRARGVGAPEVFAEDRAAGLALIEDMGDGLLAKEAADPAAERAHYARALGVLHRLREEGARVGPIGDWALQDYDETALLAEAWLLPQWYAPFAQGARLSDGAEADYLYAWRQVLRALGPCDSLVLRDFHAENLIVREGSVGVIDFQDALVGSAAYDLASLLEDARRDLDPANAEDLYREYLSAVPDKVRFETDYAILAAQRNAKILGIFARLVKRDGKPRYEGFMPRVRAHLRRDLARAPLAPVREWAARHMPELVHG